MSVDVECVWVPMQSKLYVSFSGCFILVVFQLWKFKYVYFYDYYCGITAKINTLRRSVTEFFLTFLVCVIS